MNNDNIYASPDTNNDEAPLSPIVQVAGNLLAIFILIVQVILWLLVCLGAGGIVWRLSRPYYYLYIEGVDEVILSPGYYYTFVVRPGIVALIFAAVALGLGRLRRRIRRQVTSR